MKSLVHVIVPCPRSATVSKLCRRRQDVAVNKADKETDVSWFEHNPFMQADRIPYWLINMRCCKESVKD